jgi:hypothetical protein
MEWKIIFFITSKKNIKADLFLSFSLTLCIVNQGGVYLFGCIVYWIWAQGKVQPWALQTASPDEGNHEFSLPNK